MIFNENGHCSKSLLFVTMMSIWVKSISTSLINFKLELWFPIFPIFLNTNIFSSRDFLIFQFSVIQLTFRAIFSVDLGENDPNSDPDPDLKSCLITNPPVTPSWPNSNVNWKVRKNIPTRLTNIQSLYNTDCSIIYSSSDRWPAVDV